MSPLTVYLVTGASRGVGLALVQQLAQKSNNIVVAAVRDINLHTCHPLSRLITEKPKSVVLVNLSSANEKEHVAVAAMMKERFGKVDVIIANAASNSGVQSIATVSPVVLRAEIEVNTIGPLILFQAFASLLEASENAKLVAISSTCGQIADSLPFPYDGYGLSKTGLNYIAKKINQEVQGVISFPLHPGIVDTDMARMVAEQSGTTLDLFDPITAEASASCILAIVDAATKETHGGRFWNYDGRELTY